MQVRVLVYVDARLVCGGHTALHAHAPSLCVPHSFTDGALLVYDITDEQSFKRVQEWVKELRKMLGDEIVIAIAGGIGGYFAVTESKKKDAKPAA